MVTKFTADSAEISTIVSAIDTDSEVSVANDKDEVVDLARKQ